MRRVTVTVPADPCARRRGAGDHSAGRRALCRALAALATVAALPVAAQAARVLHVAWVSTEREDLQSPTLSALREELASLGHMEQRGERPGPRDPAVAARARRP